MYTIALYSDSDTNLRKAAPVKVRENKSLQCSSQLFLEKDTQRQENQGAVQNIVDTQ